MTTANPTAWLLSWCHWFAMQICYTEYLAHNERHVASEHLGTETYGEW